MKTQFKNPVKNFAPVFLMLMAMFLLGIGCNTPKPTPDPLAGWQKDYNHQPDSAVEKDYQEYIQKLPPEEKKFATVDAWLMDATGQHAILITIGLNGTNWRHILIYDKDNKRIKIIKYVSGHSAS
jgi:hypothetical protein